MMELPTPKIGLEIHQQLATGKLFCSCPSELEEEFTSIVTRRLRATTGEGGKIDRSAREEQKKHRSFAYQITPNTSCLVELDEEPPHEMNGKALKTTLTFAAMIHATPVDEIHTMRKIVIDGSNTSGFQRTSIVALGGVIETRSGSSIPVETVCLEEDAARKIEENGNKVTYRLDRLGIPLIEIATAPEIRSGREAMEVARRIGALLRSTKSVKRGLGTIREDVNISIPGGARIEIKGVQELRLIEDYVNTEVKRQVHLLTVMEELKKRGAKPPAASDVKDVTHIFSESGSKVIRSALKKKGVVFALPLRGFGGLLGGEKGIRLGSELAGRVRPLGVKGLFHSDELPAYGITDKEVAAVRESLSLGENDGFVLIAEAAERAMKGMEAVAERAVEALAGIPSETRDPLPDGTTRYSRPISGGSRMYPETDIPPIEITGRMMDDIKSNLPEPPEEVEKRLVSEYSLSPQMAHQMVDDGLDSDFEELVKTHGMPSIIARIYLNYLPEIRRDAAKEGNGPDWDYALIRNSVDGVLAALAGGKFSKEAVPDVLKGVLVKGMAVDDVIKELGLSSADTGEIDAVIDRVISERMDFVVERKEGAVGPLMGVVMKELRGKADGRVISERLKKAISSALESD